MNDLRWPAHIPSIYGQHQHQTADHQPQVEHQNCDQTCTHRCLKCHRYSSGNSDHLRGWFAAYGFGLTGLKTIQSNRLANCGSHSSTSRRPQPGQSPGSLRHAGAVVRFGPPAVDHRENVKSIDTFAFRAAIQGLLPGSGRIWRRRSQKNPCPPRPGLVQNRAGPSLRVRADSIPMAPPCRPRVAGLSEEP